MKDFQHARLLETIEQIRLRQHVAVLYDNEAHKFEVLIPFIRDGVDKGARCLYIATADDAALARQALQEGDFDCAAALAGGSLVMSTPLDFLPEGKPFDSDDYKTYLQNALADAVAAGFTSLRICDEKSWILDIVAMSREVMDHDIRINDFVINHDVTLACMYDMSRFSSEIIREVIYANPVIFYRQTAIDNYIYLPPDKFFRPDRLDVEVKQLLEGMMAQEQRLNKQQKQIALLDAVLMNTTDAVFVKDLSGRYLMINPAGAALSGKTVDEIIGRTDAEILPPETAARHRELDCEAAASDIPKTVKLTVSFSGRQLTLLKTMGRYRDKNGKIAGTFGISRDITDLSEMEAALRRSEEHFRRYFDLGVAGLAYTSREKGILEVNQRMCEILGYDRSELLQKTWTEITHPDDLDSDVIEFNRVMDGEIDGYGLQKRFIRKDGEVVYCDISVKALRDEEGSVDAFLGIVQDITGTKLAQQRIAEYEERLRASACELSLAEEKQRRQIAAALHDSIGQTLALAKIKLESLKAGECSAEDIGRVVTLLKSAIDHTRSLTAELSPPLLYELGLETAAHSLCDSFTEQYGISVEFAGDGRVDPLEGPLPMILYQAIRELLVNIIKHAKATVANVSMRRIGQEVWVTVQDNGTGFDSSSIDDRATSTAGFGLFNMRERLIHVGGSFDLASSGAGTRVTLKAPVQHAHQRPMPTTPQEG